MNNRDLANDIDRGIWNASLLLGVYVYGFLAIALLGVAGVAFGAKFGTLAAAASAGLAWLAQNTQLYNPSPNNAVSETLVISAAVAGAASGIFTIFGV